MEEIRQAVCQYTERAAEKLRDERLCCRHIFTFIKTSPFAVNEPYYGNVATEKLNTPTCDTRDIIAAAVRVLDRIWIDDHRYTKTGIMINDFSPNGICQSNLFDEVQPRSHSDALMPVLNGINHPGMGKNMVCRTRYCTKMADETRNAIPSIYHAVEGVTCSPLMSKDYRT